MLTHGTARDADRFLVEALWVRSASCLPIVDVMDWIVALHERGEEFASHVSACSYWLYEHAADAPNLLQAWEKEQRARATAR